MDIKNVIESKLKELADICKENNLEFLFRITDENWKELATLYSYSDNGIDGFFQRLVDEFK